MSTFKLLNTIRFTNLTLNKRSGTFLIWKKLIKNDLTRVCFSSDAEISDSSDNSKKLDLAKPRKKRSKEPIENIKELEITKSLDRKIDENLLLALKDVAKSLPGDEKVIESDLLTQLRGHTKQDDDQTVVSSSQTSQMLSSMKVSKGNQDGGFSRRGRENVQDTRDSSDNGPQVGSVLHSMIEKKPFKHKFPKQINVKLFDGPRLEIFSDELSADTKGEKIMYDVLNGELFDKAVRYPAANNFEEMIRWTKEGKMWTFPINNEEGLDEEATVEFHEHVFLEHLLEDFPKKGPIRVFMELVVVGLSKNAYLTIKEKKDHINWFKNYFMEKQVILDEVFKEQKDFVDFSGNKIEAGSSS